MIAMMNILYFWVPFRSDGRQREPAAAEPAAAAGLGPETGPGTAAAAPAAAPAAATAAASAAATTSAAAAAPAATAAATTTAATATTKFEFCGPKSGHDGRTGHATTTTATTHAG